MSDQADSSISLQGKKDEKYLINVIPDRGDALSIELAPCLVSLNLTSNLFKSEYGGNSSRIRLFDAALYAGGMGFPDCVWLFRGEDCYRYNLRKGEFEVGPIRMSEVFGSNDFPLHLVSGIDSAVWAGPSYPDLIFFLKGNLYSRYKISSRQFEIASDLMTNGWFSAQDTWLSETQGVVSLHAIETRYPAMLHFFKGDGYIRHNLNDGRAVAGPMPLVNEWQLPEPFAQGFDLAFYGVGSESQKIYIFKADQFLVYDLRTSSVSSPPRSVLSKFPAFAPFIRRPQLFLVESYRLTTYYGDLSPENFVSGPQIGPGSKETYTVRIKRTTITDITQTKTILESQDQRLVKNLNESIKTNSASGTETEKYDWKVDSSFQAEVGWDIGGGDLDAQLNAQGGTNNVRTQFSQAAEQGVQQQVNNTYENHKQNISSVNSGYQATDEFESVWTREVSNPTGEVISLAYAQLAQEYITLVILEDIKLAFSNGEEVEMIPLSKMDTLLAKYISDTTQQERAKTWIVNELSEVLDYQGTPRKVIKEISSQRYQFDPELTSKLQLKKLDGTLRQEIEVDGVIIGRHRFKQLTDLVVLTEVGIG